VTPRVGREGEERRNIKPSCQLTHVQEKNTNKLRGGFWIRKMILKEIYTMVRYLNQLQIQ
jgi:hypothetical protein